MAKRKDVVPIGMVRREGHLVKCATGWEFSIEQDGIRIDLHDDSGVVFATTRPTRIENFDTIIGMMMFYSHKLKNGTSDEEFVRDMKERFQPN